MAEDNNSLPNKIGYTFQDQSLCDEALTTAGVLFQVSGAYGHVDGNASLALLGDGILRVVISMRSRELRESKGQASSRMQQVANNHNLANIFDTADLGPHVIGNPSQQGSISPKTKATIVEALLGATYEDAGMDAALAVMRHLRIE